MISNDTLSRGTSSNERPSILCMIQGGLGNQLFIVATALHLSRTQKVPLLIPRTTKSTPASVFTPERLTYWDTVFHKIPLVDEEDIKGIEPRLRLKEMNINDKYTFPSITIPTLLEGYFQSSCYFTRETTDQFQLPREQAARVDQIWKTTILPHRIGDQKIVFLHVRRGDYVHLHHFHVILPVEWYQRACSHFGNDCLYVLFSDDPEWTRNNIQSLPLLSNSVIIKDKDYIELFLMSRCDGGIISASTFSWWGAYLGKKDKKVVCPSIWFKDYFPQKWMRNEKDWIEEQVF